MPSAFQAADEVCLASFLVLWLLVQGLYVAQFTSCMSQRRGTRDSALRAAQVKAAAPGLHVVPAEELQEGDGRQNQRVLRARPRGARRGAVQWHGLPRAVVLTEPLWAGAHSQREWAGAPYESQHDA